MKPPVLVLFVAFTPVWLAAADDRAPLSLRFDPAAVYEAQFELVGTVEMEGQQEDAMFFRIAMELAPAAAAVGDDAVHRVVARNVRLFTHGRGQLADPDNADRLREAFEQIDLPVPLALDGTVDDARIGALHPAREDYTRLLVDALVPRYPAPPVDQRGATIVLVDGDVQESSTHRITPHVGYFDGWVEALAGGAPPPGVPLLHSFKTVPARPADPAIAKFVYHGSKQNASFELVLFTDVELRTLVASRLRFWSKAGAGGDSIQAWKTWHIRLKSPP